MMPKPTESEKKIWPYAAIHTPGSDSTPQLGVKKVLRPSRAPSRNSERITRATNRTTRSGMKNNAVRPMPFWTPAMRIPSVTTQTTTSTIVISGTKSRPNPDPACRNSSAKNEDVSS